MTTPEQFDFDVFLAHNSADKPQVKAIANKLEERGLKTWLDERQILAGQLFQSEIQDAISRSKSAAIFIGSTGLGRWQEIEFQVLFNQFVERKCTIVPVLLPGVDKIPENLPFLQIINWVRFGNIDDSSALDKLEQGINGQVVINNVGVQTIHTNITQNTYQSSANIKKGMKQRKIDVLQKEAEIILKQWESEISDVRRYQLWQSLEQKLIQLEEEERS